ncbi:pectinesterase [Xylogone sp. PMI_703]|nr:pectinesterase [Xylogone sp. PMI_703]
MKLLTFVSILLSTVAAAPSNNNKLQLSPRNGQKNVNIDTHLVLTFPSSPTIGSNGTIRVYDTSNRKLIDTLDLSIPFSPSPYGNGSTKANYSDTTTYQTNIIGGMDFYFYPIIIHDNTATIYLHNNQLEYGKTYHVEIDPEVLVLSQGSPFQGFSSKSPWTFSTKAHGPAAGSTQVTVAADGSADFNTVQGAIDWAPPNSVKRITIYIKNGNYEELVYWQYKNNLLLRGQSRTKVIVGYPNNSAFNPPNRQGPSRRPAFSFHGVTDTQLSSFTINNYYKGQAEALLVEGTRVIIDNMNLNGSGDAFTTYGTIYVVDSTLTGDGDTVLGYGSVYWLRSEIISGGPAVTWTRTVEGIHGNVFVDGTIRGVGNSTFARLPDNSGGVMPNWPYAELVLINTKTDGIDPVGWGPVQGPPFDASHLHLWEYRTMNLQGQLVDTSERLNVSRQLKLPQDAQILKDYTNPAYVLGGWTPVVV